jgi:16S rRNA (guanine527-N7)-methyltransferase
MIDKSYLLELCQQFELPLNEQQAEQLDKYAQLLVEWNEKINLTAITEQRDIVVKHFVDSLLLTKAIDLPEGASLIDVGTGAGFPSVPVTVLRSDIKLTLLDSLNKRLVFLQELCKEIGVKSATVHARAEDGGKNPIYREKYDIACARAVANMPVLMEYCTPFVKVGGRFIAMKGPSAKDEVALCDNAIKVLKMEKPQIICEKLPNNDPRTFVIFKKISQTPPKYPRNSGNISKQPL